MFISNTEEEKKEMLNTIGVKSFEELINQIPKKYITSNFNLPNALNEMEAYNKMKELSKKNRIIKSFIGAGVYERYIPAVIKHIITRTEFLTAYTPYQAEASQGTLQAIYEFQSIISELYGMDYSNASMYDVSTSLAEAVKACARISEKKKILYSKLINPRYIEVVKTYFSAKDDYIFAEIPSKDGETDSDALKEMIDEDICCVIVSSPNYLGIIEDIEKINSIAKEKNILTICIADPVSLSILKTPGEAGFDFAVGEGQSLGLPLSYGGPYLGIFTCKKEYLRQMPGRICGMTQDKDGKRGFVLTLQAREQHIRREKAPSNICTNQALCALWATIYVTLLGKNGLKELACLNHQLAVEAKNLFEKKGIKLKHNKPFFNEFVIELPIEAKTLRKNIVEEFSIDPGLELEDFDKEYKNNLLIAFTETKKQKDIEELIEVLFKKINNPC
ncbi:MAG: aminomethyl-transferring glycine dehydrogenase subunit GcvPA [Elusimicrobiales bacterium]|nr:aminomethyl-transferring glycine dehydrogenase subunit GcvPA [Elusimicrobiales bacterium]